MRRLVVRTDGAARGNPGPAGAGWVVETPEGSIVAEGCAYLGSLTNNQAEYEALLRGLAAAAPDRETEIEVYSDSELVVRQLTGEYRVKNEDLRPRWFRAVEALERAASWSAHHVPRAENAAADALANQAIDAFDAAAPESAASDPG
ncbi:MAG TPA: ribonuclease HI family protein [Gemmatimonadota bacterium]|nr:ribonuclease HI family protein [Gemmatimonadota bacterium]